ncbi:hypothetical protein SLOPH_720 [Spraguea lophii 42_110]|uniref:Uncharacterized protein n=1 Tax=Spraguea lophii (strain 42_110) TaxID=1358809 RepID=S7WAY3_SPRLO|nr:hypothetical protein SLOPH_720 [Spraguea lophii 42_110]
MTFKTIFRIIFTIFFIFLIAGFGLFVYLFYKTNKECKNFKIPFEDRGKDTIVIDNDLFKIYFERINNIYTSDHKLKEESIQFNDNKYKIRIGEEMATIGLSSESDQPSKSLYESKKPKGFLNPIYYLKMYKIRNIEIKSKSDEGEYKVYTLSKKKEDCRLVLSNMKIKFSKFAPSCDVRTELVEPKLIDQPNPKHKISNFKIIEKKPRKLLLEKKLKRIESFKDNENIVNFPIEEESKNPNVLSNSDKKPQETFKSEKNIDEIDTNAIETGEIENDECLYSEPKNEREKGAEIMIENSSNELRKEE